MEPAWEPEPLDPLCPKYRPSTPSTDTLYGSVRNSDNQPRPDPLNQNPYFTPRSLVPSEYMSV